VYSRPRKRQPLLIMLTGRRGGAGSDGMADAKDEVMIFLTDSGTVAGVTIQALGSGNSLGYVGEPSVVLCQLS
jgi:hypothetical protein